VTRVPMHTIAQDIDDPGRVLISPFPQDQFDRANGIVMIHQMGTPYLDGPVSFQSALTKGEWESTDDEVEVLNIDDKILDVLRATTGRF
jgi:hypothetical protein